VSGGDGMAREDFGASATFVYLTTTGRRTGRPHTIEIWAAAHARRLYLMAGGRDRADWVRNLMQQPSVQVRVGDETRAGVARLAQDPEEDALARRLLAAKYQRWREGRPMTEWARTALPVVIEFPGSGPGA
jgi:deazaflavin-dependent oxidoreductase (nitroreductase family)